MKLVTFSRDMRPHHVNDQRLVPDDVAVRLESAGDIQPNPPSFPAEPAEEAEPETVRPRRTGRLYQTK